MLFTHLQMIIATKRLGNFNEFFSVHIGMYIKCNFFNYIIRDFTDNDRIIYRSHIFFITIQNMYNTGIYWYFCNCFWWTNKHFFQCFLCINLCKKKAFIIPIFNFLTKFMLSTNKKKKKNWLYL